MENNLLRTEQCSLTDPQVLLIVSVFVNNFRRMTTDLTVSS